MEKRPNILFLMSDQHNAEVLGYAGDRVVRTPNLDRLAAGAVVFESCYTPSPICAPGRQCMMAGQLPGTCGAKGWADDLPPNYMTFARRFSEFAYATVCCGKLHHCGTDQMQGWLHRIGYDNAIHERYIENRDEASFAKLAERPSQWWPWDKEVRRAGVGRSPHHAKDDIAIAGALAYIEEKFCSPYYDQQNPGQSLLLKVSLTKPHYPFLTDADKFNYYLNRVEPIIEPVSGHPVLGDFPVVVGRDASEREARRATAAYYGMVESLDAQFGQVLGQLEMAGEDIDEWIIVYTSDHGEMLGRHGCWMKYKFYEDSARVPLFIRYPRSFAPRRVARNVNLCDLFQTLCDLAGIPAPAGLDSRSLLGLMGGDESAWDDTTYSQLDGYHMIKKGALKYMYFGDSTPEVLFDLSKDPGETCDLAAEPSAAAEMAMFRGLWRQRSW